MRVNNLYVWSNAEIGSNLEVKGAMAVTGSVTHSGNLTIGGNLAVTGTAEFSDAVNFNGSNIQFGTGVYLKATGGKLYAGSTSGGSDLDFVAGTLTLKKDYPENNDLRGGIAISRGVSGGNGADGIGTSISFNLENSAGALTPAGAIEVSFKNVTNGSEDTIINISGKVNGTTTDLLTFTGTKWQFYGGLDQVSVTNTYIVDKKLVLNSGGGGGSSKDCGVYVEEAGDAYNLIGTGGIGLEDCVIISNPYVSRNSEKVTKLTLLGSSGIKSAQIEPIVHSWSGAHEYTDFRVNTLVDGTLTQTFKVNSYNDPISTICVGPSRSTPIMVYNHVIAYNNSPQTIAVPAGMIVRNIMVYVNEAFNDTGTDLLDIGITGDLERYVADLDVSTTGWKTLTLTNVPDIIGAGGTNIVLTYTGENANATAGQATIYLEYIYQG